MKRTPIAGAASALFLDATLVLGGCGGDPASISSPSSPSSPSSSSQPSPDSSVSSTAAPSSDNTSEPTSAVTSSIIVPGALTKEQAIEVTKALQDRVSIMFSILSFPTFPSLVEMDESQTIPGEPDFWLVTDERFQSLAELRAYVETVYTPAYVDKYLSSYFEDKDVKEGPSYKEYEGRFYANSNLAGIGNIAITMWDTLRILSQDENSLTVEVDLNIDDTYMQTETYSMKKSGEVWRLDDKSSSELIDIE